MTPAPRSSWMLPSATLTIVVSRKVRNRTASTVISAARRGPAEATSAPVLLRPVRLSGARRFLARGRPGAAGTGQSLPDELLPPAAEVLFLSPEPEQPTSASVSANPVHASTRPRGRIMRRTPLFAFAK